MRLVQRSRPHAWMGMGGSSRGPLRAVGCLSCRLRLDQSQPGVVDAHPGQRIRLTCRTEGFPPPTIEWQRDGQTLSSPRLVRSSPLPAVPTPRCAGPWGKELPGVTGQSAALEMELLGTGLTGPFRSS